MPRTSSRPIAYNRSSPTKDTVVLSGPYPGPMNPRVRRLIVSGVLGGLVLIVVVAAIWDSLH